MANVIKFPPRYLHPEPSVLGREILRLVRECGARTVDDLTRLTGANPMVINTLLDRVVAMRGGGMKLQDAIVIWTPDTDHVRLVHKDTHWQRTKLASV